MEPTHILEDKSDPSPSPASSTTPQCPSPAPAAGSPLSANIHSAHQLGVAVVTLSVPQFEPIALHNTKYKTYVSMQSPVGLAPQRDATAPPCPAILLEGHHMLRGS